MIGINGHQIFQKNRLFKRSFFYHFLKTDQIIYNVENETIITKGKTISKIDNNYEIIGSELFHDRLGMVFSSKENTIINDKVKAT